MLPLQFVRRNGARIGLRLLSTRVQGPLYKMAPLTRESKVNAFG